MKAKADLKQQILALLDSADSGGLRKSDLKRALQCTSGKGQQAFRDCFRELMATGVMLKKRGGRYVASRQAALIPGTISVNPRGFAFVRLDTEGADVFVPPKYVGGAISGDRVLIQCVENGDDERGPVGHVTKITERRHQTIVACLSEWGSVIGVRPLRKELPEFIPLQFPIPEEITQSVYDGDWVRAELCPQDGADDPLQARVVERLGSGRSITSDLDAIVEEFELPEPYSAEMNAAAADLAPAEIPRVDLRELCTVTIDPTDAKDFDDALSVERGETEDTIRIGVHIADVAAYIPAGSALDLEARSRGFTAYLPGRTLPMLPRTLAADTCSLREGVDRLAHTVLLTISRQDGSIVRSERCHSLIRVTKRLSFGAVRDLLKGHRDAAGDIAAPVSSALSELASLAEIMRTGRRRREHFLELAVPEVRVLASEDPPRITGLVRVEPNPAHQLVEEYMLAANCAVAEELLQREIPALYRNHADPKPSDLEEFASWASFVVGGRKPRIGDREELNAFLQEAAKLPTRDIVLSYFLRALPRATYGSGCSGHYGLGKERYGHFTSPIRRYPDLLVHQQLLAADLQTTGHSAQACEEAAEIATAAEQRIDTAFYAAVDRLKLRYLRDQELQSPGQIHEGIVLKVNGDGATVHLPDIGLVGRLPARAIGEGRPRVSRNGMSLELRGSGKIVSCGDVIYTQIRSADTVRGVLELQSVQVRV